MPTAEAAIYQFLSGFGIPAYASASVPSDAEFPYLTYDLVVGSWGQLEANMPVNAWFRTDSEAVPNAFVRSFGASLGLGGVLLGCEGGSVWLKKGSPFAQAVQVDGEDEKIKRRYINVNIEYLIP